MGPHEAGQPDGDRPSFHVAPATGWVNDPKCVAPPCVGRAGTSSSFLARMCRRRCHSCPACCHHRPPAQWTNHVSRPLSPVSPARCCVSSNSTPHLLTAPCSPACVPACFTCPPPSCPGSTHPPGILAQLRLPAHTVSALYPCTTAAVTAAATAFTSTCPAAASGRLGSCGGTPSVTTWLHGPGCLQRLSRHRRRWTLMAASAAARRLTQMAHLFCCTPACGCEPTQLRRRCHRQTVTCSCLLLNHSCWLCQQSQARSAAYVCIRAN